MRITRNCIRKTVKEKSQTQTKPHKSRTLQEGKNEKKKKNNDFPFSSGKKLKWESIEHLTIRFPTRDTERKLSIGITFFFLIIFYSLVIL